MNTYILHADLHQEVLAQKRIDPITAKKMKINSVKNTFLLTLFFSFLSLMVFSCVSPKKYKAKVAEVEKKEQENERIKRQFYEAQKLVLLSSDSLKNIIFLNINFNFSNGLGCISMKQNIMFSS